MPSIIDNELHWATMTEVANRRPTKYTPLKELLGFESNTVTLDTEHIEYDEIRGDRAMAPMVLKNGEAVYVGGRSTARHLIEAPNIKIKRGLEASKLLSTRRPGTGIFPQSGEMNSARSRYIADELDYMLDLIEYREEWMASQILRGSVTYSPNDDTLDTFTITFPRPATHNVTLTGNALWDSGVAADIDITGNFLDSSSIMSESQGGAPTDVILGKRAFNAFRKNAQLKDELDKERFDIGALSIDKFQGAGFLPVGRLHGMNVWTYQRQITGDDGSQYDFIRPDYAEFIHRGPLADNRTYFAAIADMGAGRSGIFEGRRFSKAWETEDPSSWTSMVQTRPLMVPRNPEVHLSMKVVS